MTALRILNILIWGGLLLYMAPAALQAVKGHAVRRGDPMRLGVAWVCLVMILGNLRWLLAPDNQNLFYAIYCLSAAVGCYIAYLAYVYGRGPML